MFDDHWSVFFCSNIFRNYKSKELQTDLICPWKLKWPANHIGFSNVSRLIDIICFVLSVCFVLFCSNFNHKHYRAKLWMFPGFFKVFVSKILKLFYFSNRSFSPKSFKYCLFTFQNYCRFFIKESISPKVRNCESRLPFQTFVFLMLKLVS